MINYQTIKKLVWDDDQQQMSLKTEVIVQLIGTAGTVFAEEGPLFCSTGYEVYQASMILKERLIKNLS